MKIQNPILKGFNPDPSICRVGEDYYIATSTFEWFPGVQIHHSKDLKNWRLISRPLNRLSLLNMHGNPDSGGVWAPALSYADGKFWLIYSDIKVVSGAWKDGHNYLTTCETIDGEWSEPIYLNSAGFDPSLYHHVDGKKYLLNMVWDHRVSNHSFYGINLQEFCQKENKLIGKAKNIFKGSDIKLTEAPHLYYINEYFYLITAEGGTTYNHAVTIARSKDLFGPYELHPENPLLTSKYASSNPIQKSGHGSIVHTHTDEWYLVHLMGRPMKGDGNSAGALGRNEAVNESQIELMSRGYCPLGRESSIQKLEWRDNWPYVVGGNAPSVEIDGPNITEVYWENEFIIKDDFNESILNKHFQTLRIPLGKDILTLDERPGYLRLYGRESHTSQFTQAFVARRWQSLHFEAETKIDFNPENFQQMAGLVNYYNTLNWVSAHISWDEEKGKIIKIMNAENGVFSEPIYGNEICVPSDIISVYLKVLIKGEVFVYSYSFDGVSWTEIPANFDSFKLSDDFVTGGGFFTGAFVGMHCQDISGARLHADFDYFRYEEF